jgi:ParB family chromosome partitioning protein
VLKKKLGRGLDALINPGNLPDPGAVAAPVAEAPAPAVAPPVEVPADTQAAVEPITSVCDLEIDRIVVNRYQPRKTFDQTSLQELMNSIGANGIIQPLVVRPSSGGKFELVAGERRYRAATALGLKIVPVVIRTVPDDRMLELALIENIQREDLNPIEKAEAFREFMNNYAHTQEVAAERLGVDRASLANHLRLLELPFDVQVLVKKGALKMGHAKAIAAVTEPELQFALAKRAIQRGMNVRQLEKMIARLTGSNLRQKAAGPERSVQAKTIEDELRKILGSKVRIRESLRKGVGRIVIDYYTFDDFDRILKVLRK